MRQCPVCGSKTYDEPVCVTCGFDISCDYGRFPTLGADIPRDLKARALQKVEGIKNEPKKPPEPTPKPADVPPVSVFSQAEIRKLTFRKGLYAFLFSIAALFFMVSIFVYTDSVSTTESGLPYDELIGVAVTVALSILFFALLKKTLKKMKPDEWAWKKKSKGQWIVLPKEKARAGKKKKMTTALMLFSFGWPFGLHAFYLDGFWRGALHCLILYGGGTLAELLTGSEGKLVMFGLDLLSEAGAIVALFMCFVIFFLPMIRIMGMAPEFDKGEF